MLAIFKKEIRTYFTTFTGYIFLCFFVLVTAFYYTFVNVIGGLANYAETLTYTVSMFLILIPLLTMRLFAEEARQKTDQLLFTSPISILQIVIGKFLAAFFLLLIGVLITMLFPLMLTKFGTIPFMETIGAVIGYILLSSCLISIGIFISVLTNNQIIAAVGTFAAIFFTLMIDNIANSMPSDTASSVIFIIAIVIGLAIIVFNSTKNIFASAVIFILGVAITAFVYFTNKFLFDGIIVKVLGWFSIISRFDNFYMGMFNITDIVYYITFSIAFLYLTINVIETRRWR